jgi:hypothetical protein
MAKYDVPQPAITRFLMPSILSLLLSNPPDDHDVGDGNGDGDGCDDNIMILLMMMTLVHTELDTPVLVEAGAVTEGTRDGLRLQRCLIRVSKTKINAHTNTHTNTNMNINTNTNTYAHINANTNTDNKVHINANTITNTNINTKECRGPNLLHDLLLCPVRVGVRRQQNNFIGGLLQATHIQRHAIASHYRHLWVKFRKLRWCSMEGGMEKREKYGGRKRKRL